MGNFKTRWESIDTPLPPLVQFGDPVKYFPVGIPEADNISALQRVADNNLEELEKILKQAGSRIMLSPNMTRVQFMTIEGINTQVITHPEEVNGELCVKVAMVADWVPVRLLKKL